MLRWGLWGCGRMAAVFATELRLVKGQVAAAVASRSGNAAVEFGARLGIPDVHKSFEAMLASPGIDVIYISTPPHCHHQDTLSALRAGKHVLCEKPLARTLAEAQEIREVASRANLFCMEGMWTSCLPAVREARRLVMSGAIGMPRFMSASFAYAENPAARARLSDPRQGGGVLMDRMVYPVHLALMLFGPAELQGAGLATDPNGFEVQASALLQHRSGVHSQLMSSFVCNASNEAVILGDEGMLRLTAPFFMTQSIDVQRTAAIERFEGKSSFVSSVTRKAMLRLQRRFGISRLRFPYAGRGYTCEISEVGRCIEVGLLESPLAPLQDSCDVLEILGGIRDSGVGGRKHKGGAG